ncbi:MAG TPA: ABC transporter substrate-binding protein [Xanthobacteraceae bacterium]|jgi:NitT/TauT family transport system substrate-binding protein|nr:ABC transporter substrate-binding protein [Xanthobacteraceae bacterium]
MTKKAAYFIAACIALAFAAGAPAMVQSAIVQPAMAQSAKPWRHGLIQPKSDAGILMMAAERGFFKKMGLDVQIVPVKDDQILLKAVIAGDLDSFEGGPSGAIVAASHGADVKILGCTWLMVPHGIFVHDDITSMDQLKGKTMAISSPGAFPDIFARGALAHYNIPEDAMKYANLGGDLDRYKALVAHVVDAAVISGEYAPIAAKEHIKMLVSAKEALPKFLRMCITANGAAVNARPQDAAKFIAGEMLGLRYAATHKDEVIKVTQEVTGIKPDDPRPAYIYDLAMADNAIGTDVPIPRDNFDWLNHELVKVGSLSEPMDLSKILDDKPRQDALKLIAAMH